VKQNKNIVGLERCTRVQMVGFWLLSIEPEIQEFMWGLWYGTWSTGAEKRLNICTDFLQQAEADEDTKKLIIMSDELWVYDTMSKQSTSSLHSRSQNLPQDWQKHSRGDWMWGPCLLASNVEVWVPYRFVGRGPTVNQVICVTPFTGTNMKETS